KTETGRHLLDLTWHERSDLQHGKERARFRLTLRILIRRSAAPRRVRELIEQPSRTPQPTELSVNRVMEPVVDRETIMNGAEALERSGRGFRQRLVEVESDDWARPTPCDEWSVRDLVNHVVSGNIRYVMILAGEPDDAVLRTREHDWLGSDPLGSFDDAL